MSNEPFPENCQDCDSFSRCCFGHEVLECPRNQEAAEAVRQAKLVLLIAPDRRLREKCSPVPFINETVVALGRFLESQLDPLEAAGLAAPQFGLLTRIIAVRIDNQTTRAIVNPVITRERGEHFVYEACRSLPGRQYKVKRPKIVKVKGLGLDGSAITVKGSDFLAQVLVHEIQHLDGIMLDTIGTPHPVV